METKVIGRGRIMWPDWSVTNQITLTFCEDTLDGIAVINADGSNYQVLVPQYGMISRWSPDGKQIAFHGFLPGAQNGPGLYVMNADGSNLHKVLDVESIGTIKWSPSGSQIAFVGSESRKSYLYIVTLDESSPVVYLPDAAGQEFAWAPNGRGIVYSPGRGLAVVDLTSRQMYGIPFAYHPAWAVTGKLAYHVSAFQFKSATPPPAAGIYIMSSSRHSIHLQAEAEELVWSPNGQKLMFKGKWRRQEGVFITDEHFGRVMCVIPRKELQVWDVCWSPDGNSILVRGDQDPRSDHHLHIIKL